MKFLTNLTLGKKITLLTAIGLLLGVGIFSSLGMRAVRQATETTLQDRLTTARIVADYVDEALGRALSELNNAAAAIEGDSGKDDPGPRMDALYSMYSRLSIYIHGVYLINQQGQVVWSRPQGIGSINPASYPSISQAIASGEASVSGLVSAPETGLPVILLASPTKRQQVLVAAVDLAQSSIAGFVQPIRLGQTGYVELIDQNGVVVARTQPGPELAPFEQSDHSGRFAALIAAGEPTRGVCHTCHEPQQRVEKKDVLAFTPLTAARWGVVVRQSEEEALAPASELRKSLLLFGVGLVVIALLFVTVTTRDVGGRIRMLTTASRRIAEGDMITHVPAAGNDEVGILAESFDYMRTKLKASHDALEQKTKELTSLLSVSRILTSISDLPALLDAVLAKAVEIIPGADAGVLLLRSGDQGDFFVQSAIGVDKDALSQSSLAAQQGDTSQAAEAGEQAKQAVAALLQSPVLRSRVRSSLSTRIFHRDQGIGGIVMTSFRDSQAFSESDRRLLHAVADYIAIAFERTRLTEEAEQAQALQEADRLRSQFISSVSHELRTPLTLIKGYSTSLLRRDISWDKASQQEFLQIIDEKTDELRDLIDKLLLSAKLEAGALRLEKEPVLIPRLARKIVDDTASRAKKHRFTLSFPPAFPVVEADVRCMEQILRNLLENAVKYSPAGGEIAIAGETGGGQVVVSVSDSGIGIPPEHLPRIFDRFYRVDSPLTHGASGSGLGLSIVKGHVEAHGGKIWLESTVGKGTTFYFSLPLNHDETEEQKEDAEALDETENVNTAGR
ncbi:MAG: GAF domain-containing protein [Chloroflexi bacterium]|nr:GAF domain-containing protein [Chloroflexota bacterium]